MDSGTTTVLTGPNGFYENGALEPCAAAFKPMKKFVRVPCVNFKAKKKYTSGIVEGLNLKVNLSLRKAYGFRSFDVLQIALFHQLGGLSEPEFTHRFC